MNVGRVSTRDGRTAPMKIRSILHFAVRDSSRAKGMSNTNNEALQSLSPIASTDGDDSSSNSTRRPVKKRKATYLLKKVIDTYTITAAVDFSKRDVHLADQESRRQTLSSIRDFKIQNGVGYIEARSHNVDLLQPYASSEQFVDEKGNLCCSLFDVTQFVGVKSVREVYNAALCHFMNEEISISERLGYITVRDDFSVEDENFSNCRLSSEDENGVKTEVNTASFAQYFGAEQAGGDKEIGVLVRDSVDVDELYPYRPSDCVRKDQMGAIVLTAAKRKKKTGGGGDCSKETEELVVIMRRAGFVKIHRPAFPLPERTQQGLLKGIMAWCDVMLSNMRGEDDTSANSPHKSARGKESVSRSSSTLDKNCGEEQRATRAKTQRFYLFNEF
ncbi:unnamed protein product [Phytophthora lilii]|uniref:Unnamed protein product n=1 Tax=Phytophthora lilii TaxID=2077276 RepID=A0A9W6UFA9_9STRA|nr:unnamed protein product [Phytophthora lilii]